MSIELVTGHAGRNHVDSEDVGAFYAGVVGKGRYALDVGENLAVTMSDANTVRIGTGLFVMDGRYVRVKDAESVKVANGAQAAYRKDLVVCTYTRDPSNGNVEDVAVSVLQGKAAAKESDAKAPTFEEGDILNGDLKATVAIAEVDLAGLTPMARLLLPNVASLKTLGDSVSHHLDTGWVSLYNDAKWGTVKYRARDGVCCLMVLGIGGIGPSAPWAVPHAIAKKFLPPSGLYATLSHRQQDHTAQVWIPGQDDSNSDGKLYIYSSIVTDDNFSRINGCVTWIYEPEPVGPEA